MGWDYEALEFWLTLAVVVISAVGGWVAGLLRKQSRRIEELEDAGAKALADLRAKAAADLRAIEIQLESKVERHESDIAALKASQITHEDLGRIYQRLEPITSQMGEVKGSIDALATQLGIVTQHLLEK